MFRKSLLANALAIATATLLGSQAHAQFVIEEVVVTAQKRAESAQDTPISISAFSETFIKESNIVGVDDLMGFTPGLNGNAQRDTVSSVTIRGIGTYAFSVGVDNSVGMYIDDVPISRSSLIGNSFFDLERVEVVKGPQGTLFGRNSSAGAISLITKKPDLEENSLEVKLGAGNESQLIYEGYGNLVLSDQLAVRASVRHDERDGQWENVATGNELNNRDHTNARLALRWEASDTVTADLSAEAIRIDTRTGTALLSQATDEKLSQNGLPTQDVQSERYLAKIAWDITDAITLTSNTSYLDYSMVVSPVDIDVTDTFVINLLEPEEGSQFMQEFRFNGNAGDVDWFVGASYIYEEIENHTTYQWNDFELAEVLVAPGFGAVLCGALPCKDNEQPHDAATENTSYAVYSDVAWSINESWKLTVGARYTSDKKEFLVNQEIGDSAISLLTGDALILLGTDGPVTDDESWTSFDPRVVLDYTLNDDVLLYTSVSSGYKSGGFNSDVANSLASGVPQVLVSFDEERVMAYEIGAKTQFWDGRAQVNTAVYYNDYEDFQLETSSLAGIFIDNAGTVEGKGFEVDATFLLSESVTLMANYSYLDATFKDTIIKNSDGVNVDISGQQLQRAPENSGGIVAIYRTPIGDMGELSIRGDYSYSDGVSFDVLDPTLSIDSYGVFNARIGFTAASDRWEVALIGENIGDEEYLVDMTAPLGAVLAIPGMRALYRVEATMRF